jgi:hypothetical protein
MPTHAGYSVSAPLKLRSDAIQVAQAMAFTASALASPHGSGHTSCSAATAASCACWWLAPARRLAR